MSYVIAAVAITLFVWVGRKRRIPGQLWIQGGLAAIIGGSVANIALGRWIAGVLSSLGSWIGGLVGASGALVIGGVALVVTIVTAGDIIADRKPDRVAQYGLMALPVLFLATGGTLAAVGGNLFDTFGQLGSQAVTTVVGG